MKNKYLISIVFIIVIFIVGFVSYNIGKNNSNKTNNMDMQTFYAIIEKITGNTILVKGIKENDINYRGAFSIEVSDDTILEWRYTAIKLADLDEGDTISISFVGEVLESYPAMIKKVEKIQLLDDEK